MSDHDGPKQVFTMLRNGRYDGPKRAHPPSRSVGKGEPFSEDEIPLLDATASVGCGKASRVAGIVGGMADPSPVLPRVFRAWALDTCSYGNIMSTMSRA